jgi:hypothetical protein
MARKAREAEMKEAVKGKKKLPRRGPGAKF